MFDLKIERRRNRFMKTSAPITLSTTVIWAILTLIVSIVLLPYPIYMHSVAVRAQSTTATVTVLLPNEHASFYYIYSVNKVVFSGRSLAADLHKSLDSISPGDSITVYFDPRQPGNSSAEHPKLQAQVSISYYVGAVLAIPLLLTGILCKMWNLAK